jgi:general secretion pathway protein G
VIKNRQPITSGTPAEFRLGAPARRAASSTRSQQSGMTLLELIIACGILLVLASAAMPVARFTVMRQKESELRRSLREVRDAIDRYKDASDRNLIRVAAGTEGYPPDLETLVQGVEIVSQGTPGQNGILAPQSGLTGVPAGNTPIGSTSTPSIGSASAASTSGMQNALHHVRFLRRVPKDPITGRAEWGLRAVQDDADSGSWGGKNVFDVYSMSTGIALDGTRYSEW